MKYIINTNSVREQERFLVQRVWRCCAILAMFGMPFASGGQTARMSHQVSPEKGSSTSVPSANKLRPGDVYKEAMQPLDIVRRSLNNWSDPELGALRAGVELARNACAQSKPAEYSGNDLYDYARLCTLGQDWNMANAAALYYINSEAEPHRAQAYELSMNAMVHLGFLGNATQTALEMLHKLPYDADVAYAVEYMKTTLREASNSAALTLAYEEHGAIVTALAGGVALKATHGDSSIGVGELYLSAMQLAFLERYFGDDEAAKSTVADLQEALATAPELGAADRQTIEATNTQYDLLGKQLPHVDVIKAVFPSRAGARIDPHSGGATILVLFPEWCAQCARIMQRLNAFVISRPEMHIHEYGLMFRDQPQVTAQQSAAEILKSLKGTDTLVVPAKTAEAFGATDYPLGIVTDAKGNVRFIGVLPENAFAAHGYMDHVIDRIIRRATTK